MSKYIVRFFVCLIGLFLVYGSGEKISKSNLNDLNLTAQSKNRENLSPGSASVKIDVNFAKIPLYFIHNKGQVNKKVLFYSKASRYTLWITKEGLVFDSMKAQGAVRRGQGAESHHRGTQSSQQGKTKYLRDVSRLDFVNAKKSPEIVPVKETKLKVNFFKGNDPSKWHCDVPTSQAVLYKSLYKNIDLKVYGIEKQVEYDWVVKPGGDPGDIKFEYNNVKNTRLDDEGNLLIETDFGELVHKRPVSYQRIGVGAGPRACPQEREDIDVTFKKIGKNTYGFEVGKYDESCELVIDPVVLTYSTYLGGTGSDWGNGIAVDNSGYVYVTGRTFSTDFPTLNQYQSSQGINNTDAFVTKIDTTQIGASSLVYSTYLGGAIGADGANSIAVDNSEIVYVTGSTMSADFPTLNPYQTDQGGPDVFVTKLDTTQSGVSSLIYSTYVGGDSDDLGNGIIVDSSGYVYVTGSTFSTDFPILNQYQTYQGIYDAFVIKLDTSQQGVSCLLYSTYLGGENWELGHGIAADNSGNVYVTGETSSGDFPTLNQYQTFQGDRDVYVTKLDTTQSGASSLVYSTCLGSGWSDYGYDIVLDDMGYVYVTGETIGPGFPILNQYQTFQGNDDAFIAKIDTTQIGDLSLIYSTYFGGSNYDMGYGIDVDNNGNVYVTGETNSEDFPIKNPYQTGLVGNCDVFVAKINTTKSGAMSLVYSTYLGGEDHDQGNSIAVDSSRNAYVTGNTYSTNFPLQYPYQAYQGLYDTFVTKLDAFPPPSITVTSPNGGESWAVGLRQTITWSSTGYVGNVDIEYSTNNGESWTAIAISTPNDGSRLWTVPDTVSNQCLIRVSETGGSPVDTSDEVFSIVPTPTITVTSPNGGEEWLVGTPQTITWTCEGSVENVIIRCSFDGGTAWKTIAVSTENDGHFDWLAPNRPSGNCLIRVIVNDDDQGPADVSDEVFSIVSPTPGSIIVRSPNGGESYLTGSTQQIKWNSTGDINQVNIKYSTDNGTTWKLIAQTTANDGSYNWVVPGTVSDKCLVQVTAGGGAGDSWPADVSDSVFSIVLPSSPPTITVTAPNGGEQLIVGSRIHITWLAVNMEYPRKDVKIEYSLNGGQDWTIITGAVDNNGDYHWLVPDTPSDDCLVRIAEIDGQPEDVSDAVFSIVSPSPGDITVTSPNGGETWEVESSYEIKWDSTGIDHVTIEYSQDNGTTWKTIVQTTPNSGSFDWTIPETASEECLVRITSNDGGTDPRPSDVSDSVFSIVPPPPPTIKVTAPNGGEQLQVGSRFDITWLSSGTREDVKIEYSIDSGDTWTVIADAAENNGKYDWLVPDTPSETCLVRISETDGQPMDISDAVFSIVQPVPGEITVTSPNGGENWTGGSLQEIKWTNTGDINSVNIKYSTDNGVTWIVIVQTTANDGSFDWTIPDTASDECLVRVTANDDDLDPKPSDVSDGVFSIISSSPSFRVTSPNGGESWEVDSVHAITWNSTGTTSDIMIDYSFDNGTTWSIIVSSTLNSGSYDWNVPGTVSEECLVRVTANDGGGDPKPSDVSDEVFSIVLPPSPTITVIVPNGGEELTVGSGFNITWYAIGPSEDVKIEYTGNGGETWTEITNATQNDGDYHWIIPDEPSETCLVRISEIDGEPVDISDAVFSIVSPIPGDIIVTSPNGGESLEAGSQHDITWDSSGIDNVVIKYSTDNGVTWATIGTAPAPEGIYTWVVPGTPSETCLVQVTAADAGLDPRPSDVSDQVFSIVLPYTGAIRVDSPNGGETLTAGSQYDITWTSTGVNSVIIEYSVDNGAEWIYIDTVAAGEGRYTWTVPQTPSQTCLVRISGNTPGEDPFDISDDVFSILAI